MSSAAGEPAADGMDPAPVVLPRLALRPVPRLATVATKLCAERHPNNPDVARCRVCERVFDPAAEVVEMAPGPVARLLLEDGSSIDLGDPLVIGRSPVGGDIPVDGIDTGDIDTGGADTLTVSGRQVSRRHLLLEPRGWELRIRDCGSTNGTFLSRRGERGRRRVPADEAIAVRIGDSIHFGSRQALVVAAGTS